MHEGKCPSVVSIPHEGATHASRSEFCLVFSLFVFWATPVENVWPPLSKSVHSQGSTALRTVTFVRAWICTSSRLQAKGRRCYLSQNIGSVVTRSAGPALLPLCRNPCQELFQGRNKRWRLKLHAWLLGRPSSCTHAWWSLPSVMLVEESFSLVGLHTGVYNSPTVSVVWLWLVSNWVWTVL